MKKLFLGIVLAGLSLSSCDKENRCIRGKGESLSREYPVSEFRHLHISGSQHVEIRKSSEYKLVIEAQKNIHERVELEIAGEELEIGLKNCVMSHDGVKVFIEMPDIQNISVSGSADVLVFDAFNQTEVNYEVSGSGSISGEVLADELDAQVSGSGELKLYGYADHQKIRVSGSGDYKGFQLAGKTADVSVSGSGDAQMNVTQHMDVKISGSGDVYYLGNPTLNLSISGSGDIHKK